MSATVTELLLATMDLALWPVLGGLAILSASSLLVLGGFAREANGRRGWRPVLMRLVDRRQGDRALTTEELEGEGIGGLPRAVLERGVRDPRRVLDEMQLDAERYLEPLRVGARLGPILGLIGTLVPLGPAIAAFGDGDVKAMADELVVAFGTTVVGMSAGSLCFVAYSCRRRWYERDLNDVAYLLGGDGRS